MKFPHSGFIWVWSVRQRGPAVFISCVNDCPACRDIVMLSDRLKYLTVALPKVYPPFHSNSKAFRSCLIFLFFNLNLNSPSDSAARQNKLFKSFNEEVQSTDAGVQTHLEQRWLTSYRWTGRCAMCVFLGVGGCVTGLILRRRHLWVFKDLYWHQYFGSDAAHREYLPSLRNILFHLVASWLLQWPHPTQSDSIILYISLSSSSLQLYVAYTEWNIQTSLSNGDMEI